MDIEKKLTVLMLYWWINPINGILYCNKLILPVGCSPNNESDREEVFFIFAGTSFLRIRFLKLSGNISANTGDIPQSLRTDFFRNLSENDFKINSILISNIP